jgi:hypothetical protein
MAGTTDCITDESWLDIFTLWFILVDDAYQALEQQHGRWRRRGPTPVFHDSEVITVALIGDTFFHGHEALALSFLGQYHPDLFPHLPREGHFNARRTVLGPLIDQIRRVLTHYWGLIDPDERDRLLDSAPIPLATYKRASQTETVAGPEYFSVMVTRQAKLFGLRLHVTVTPQGVLDEWLLAPAAVHDSQVMPALFDQATNRVGSGDGAFHNPTQAPAMAARNVVVYAPPRRDSKQREPWPKHVRRQFSTLRQPIETVFSVLSTVFDIQRPRARSLKGVVCRISTRLLAYTLCFLTQPLLVHSRTSPTPN